MDDLLQDLRFAFRFLLRNKRSTSIAVLCLATGIAMTTGTFSGVNPWVFRPLPWDEPDELVSIAEVQHELPDVLQSASAQNYRDWVREATGPAGVFSQIGAFDRTNYSFSADQEPEWVLGARVSAGLFEIYGEEPILGRAFTAEDDVEGRNAVVLLSYGLWEQRFGKDQGVIGRTVRIDGRAHEIVGVMRDGFRFPNWARAWTPLGLPITAARDDRQLWVRARMNEGVSVEQAQAHMDRVSRGLEQRFPLENGGWQALVRPLRDQLIPSGIRLGLSIQLFASLFVLLIACANAANILLALAATREKEIALRMALGATRARIVRQLLTESTFIAFVSGALGSLMSPFFIGALLTAAPQEPPYWVAMGLDHWVLSFTIVVSAITGIAFGLVPALRTSRVDLMSVLKEGGRSATRSVRGSRLAQGLVAAELALAIVLLIGATLLIRSYLALSDTDMGYDRDGVLTWRVTLPPTSYPSDESRAIFVREMVRRLQAIPGVEAAGASDSLPGTNEFTMLPFEVEGQPVPVGERPRITRHTPTEAFLETMRVRVVEGRSLRPDDVENASEVVLVSRAPASRFWPGESALGKRIRFDPEEPWLRVVGVTGDVSRPFDIAGDDTAPKWQAWVPITHSTPPVVSFALRVWGEPQAMGPRVRSEFRAADSSLPIYAMLTMDEVMLQQTWVSRLFGLMFASFAIFALLLSSVGLYGVISYGVAQRTHEVGVRMALGAQPRDVLALVMRQGLWATAIGAGAGLTLSVGMGWMLSSLLFGVETRDPLTFLGTTALLASVALLATFFPALRATRVDPVIALRSG
jgi:putative ABC transport system permease protein